MKTRGNPSGPGVIKKPHLQRPDIRMQPESCHHAQDAFAQGLGPYTEIPDYTQGRTKRYENAETRTGRFRAGDIFLTCRSGWGNGARGPLRTHCCTRESDLGLSKDRRKEYRKHF